MAFYVGQKVVCVDASNTCVLGSRELVQDRIYTIRWVGVYEGNFFDPQPNLCIRLVGVQRKNATPADPYDVPFRATRFRPVVEKKSGMDVIEHIRLGGKPEGFEEPKREKVAS